MDLWMMGLALGPGGCLATLLMLRFFTFSDGIAEGGGHLTSRVRFGLAKNLGSWTRGVVCTKTGDGVAKGLVARKSNITVSYLNFPRFGLSN